VNATMQQLGFVEIAAAACGAAAHIA